MNIGMYQSASSLAALERWQSAVTQNITSSQVTGFKKRTVEFSAIESGELQTDPRKKIGQGEGSMAYFPRASYGINFQHGETQPTRRDLDVAVQGDGFFEMKMDDGTHSYTRAGELHLRPDRTLVTAQDKPIMSSGDTEIKFLPQGGQIVITENGTVKQGEATLGRIKVVSFKDPSQLRALSAGVFKPVENQEPVTVEKPSVLQGYLESSNVAPLREMVDLVNIARAYEANQKMISSRDQTMEKTLEALG